MNYYKIQPSLNKKNPLRRSTTSLSSSMMILLRNTTKLWQQPKALLPIRTAESASNQSKVRPEQAPVFQAFPVKLSPSIIRWLNSSTIQNNQGLHKILNNTNKIVHQVLTRKEIKKLGLRMILKHGAIHRLQIKTHKCTRLSMSSTLYRLIPIKTIKNSSMK